MNEVPRYAAVVGLGFGDCGKGLFTDFLCRAWQVTLVVRFNGGAQAGHNVVLPDGRHHTFAQFGSGSFVPGVQTLLASPVVVHPSALLVEEAFLQRAGVSDAFARLRIDARCRVNTPYHQAAGRLRELLRGAGAHGSCGVGVGETVQDALAHPDAVLCYGDLPDTRRALALLSAIRQRLRAQFPYPADSASLGPQAKAELAMLDDEDIASRWLGGIAPLLKQVPPASADAVAACLRTATRVLFEGAQGALLDEWRGFHPHTTWSTTLPDAASAVLRDAGIDDSLCRLGVLRSYLTRHGAGPLPTHDPALDALLGEPHNASDGWQGAFRRGHPDAVLLRYVQAITGPLDGLLLSHLDVFERGIALRWCEAYRGATEQGAIAQLELAPTVDLCHQERLTHLLNQAEPCYAPEPVADAPSFMARMTDALRCPVLCSAWGPTLRDVHFEF